MLRTGFSWKMPFGTIVLFYLFVSVGSAETIFRRERIRVEPVRDALWVDGLYVMENNADHDVTSSLFYPFPVDSQHPFPDQITVFSKGDTLTWRESDNGVVFTIPIPSQGETEFTVVYRQPCLNNSGCYILTTTQAWQHPLERADFEIVLRDSVDLLWVSYTPEDTVRIETGRILKFSCTDFLPDTDLCLKWNNKGR